MLSNSDPREGERCPAESLLQVSWLGGCRAGLGGGGRAGMQMYWECWGRVTEHYEVATQVTHRTKPGGTGQVETLISTSPGTPTTVPSPSTAIRAKLDGRR